MSKYQCKACGYIHNCISVDGRDLIPKKCPICGAYRSTLPDIMLAWADFFVGCALFYVIQSDESGSSR